MRALLLLAAVVVAGCRSAPPTTDPLAALTLAEDMLANDRAEEAAELLEAFESTAYVDEDRERYQLRLATALHASGSSWAAFKAIRDFGEDHPVSRYIGDVAKLEFDVGRSLVLSDWSFLFFASDADDGQFVLEHFTQHFSWHALVPDALRLLGEKAFAEEDYGLARERYQELVRSHRDSEWVPLARYRIALSRFNGLVGPRYDLGELEAAHNELRDFLASGIENPEFVEKARAALATVRQWLAEKHLHIASFYWRVGNDRGRRYHLERALEGYPETEAAGRAATTLSTLETEGR